MAEDCVNLTEAARSVQTFRINAFTATKDVPNYIASKVWPVGGFDWQWQIDFLPNINSRQLYSCLGDEDCVKLRVSLVSNASGGVAASFRCFLVDPTTMKRPSQSKVTTTSSMFYRQNAPLEVFHTTRGQLNKSMYLKDVQFLVQCELTVLLGGPPAKGTAVPRLAAPRLGRGRGAAAPSDLQKHFGELLRSQNAKDITFLVAGESVPAHRCMLAARSPVFMAELFGDMKENADLSVEIKDMDAQVFKAMLHYIYTDSLPELQEQDEEEQATLMAQHLLDAADRYGLERLKEICVDKLSRDGITVETVATTLALAEQHGCAEFILSTPANLWAVAETQGFKHLEASCPSVLTDLLIKLAAAKGPNK